MIPKLTFFDKVATNKNRLKKNLLTGTKISHTVRRKKILIDNISLSQRELECIYYLAHGKSCKEISSIIGIASRTVESHMNTIKLKTGLYCKGRLVDWFWRVTHKNGFLNINSLFI